MQAECQCGQPEHADDQGVARQDKGQGQQPDCQEQGARVIAQSIRIEVGQAQGRRVEQQGQPGKQQQRLSPHLGPGGFCQAHPHRYRIQQCYQGSDRQVIGDGAQIDRQRQTVDRQEADGQKPRQQRDVQAQALFYERHKKQRQQGECQVCLPKFEH
ncbi:hypothetical protein D3C81_1389730 [compost metagenome]